MLEMGESLKICNLILQYFFSKKLSLNTLKFTTQLLHSNIFKNKNNTSMEDTINKFLN
jgi:hypothetical protein